MSDADFKAWTEQCARDMRANLEHWGNNVDEADEIARHREARFHPPDDKEVRVDYIPGQERDDHGRFAGPGLGLEGHGAGSSSGVGRAGGEPHGGSTLMHIGDQARVVGHEHPSRLTAATASLAAKLASGVHPQVGQDGRLTGKMVPVTLQGPIEKHVADVEKQIAQHTAEFPEFKAHITQIANDVAGYKPVLDKKGRETGEHRPVAIIEARVKDPAGAIGKLDRKADKYTSAASMQDTTGARIILPNIEAVRAVAEKLEHHPGFTSLPSGREDYITNPKPDVGYRSLHLILQTPSGTQKEVQLRTENQHTHADFSHDIYKPKSSQQAYVEQNAAAIAAYQRSLGEHYAGLDTGRKFPNTNVPSGPPIVKPPEGFREVLPKARHIVALHDEPAAYFHVTPSTPMIPLDKLSVTRARPEGIRNAAGHMARAAYDGAPKRAPIDVEPDPNKPGHFRVVDGNSTTNIAMRNSWKALPVTIHEPGTYVDPKDAGEQAKRKAAYESGPA